MKYTKYINSIFQGHLKNKNIPVLVTLCLTNKCNLKCTYCYEEYYDRNHKEFSTEEVFQLIDDLYRLGSRYISLNGGEPLLRKDINEIVDKVIEKNMICHISTNGLLAGKNLDVLKKVDSIAISIDGDKDSNDKTRGKGSYDKVLKTFDILKKNNIPFHTSTVLNKINQNSMKHLFDLADKYQFKIQLSILRSQDSLDKEITLSENEIVQLLNRIIQYKKEGKPIFFSEKAYETALNWPLPYETQMTFEKQFPETKKSLHCALKKFPAILKLTDMYIPVLYS